MLIDFFYTLRSAKLPVSVKEFLTLLEALQALIDVLPGRRDAGAFPWGWQRPYAAFICVYRRGPGLWRERKGQIVRVEVLVWCGSELDFATRPLAFGVCAAGAQVRRR